MPQLDMPAQAHASTTHDQSSSWAVEQHGAPDARIYTHSHTCRLKPAVLKLPSRCAGWRRSCRRGRATRLPQLLHTAACWTSACGCCRRRPLMTSTCQVCSFGGTTPHEAAGAVCASTTMTVCPLLVHSLCKQRRLLMR